jgi:ATP adenylyltransferase
MSETFDTLKTFLTKKMVMNHIYQPVMLKRIFLNGGSASVNEIAKDLLSYDQSQIEYYEDRTKNMVGKVLTSNRGITTRERNQYSLGDFHTLSDDEKQELVDLCDSLIDSYLDECKQTLYDHRRISSDYVPGSLRYQVLSRAQGRCELCGISKDEKALDVDHIIPRSKGGSDDISNLQALCYTCNRQKRNTDPTDFRSLVEQYQDRDEHCIFCSEVAKRAIHENELALAFEDKYPVTEGHTLIIPKRHVSDYFDLHQPEINAIHQLLDARKAQLQQSDPTIRGFNIGVNAGKDAGQTIFHCHVHLIPRRPGDMEDPTGGVRGVIPKRQKY